MEAARPAGPTDAERQFGTDVVLAALQRYRAGDKAAAVDIFFRGVFGPGYRTALDHGLPDAEPLDLPGLTHLLHVQDPTAVTDGLTGFFARHPIPEPPGALSSRLNGNCGRTRLRALGYHTYHHA